MNTKPRTRLLVIGVFLLGSLASLYLLDDMERAKARTFCNNVKPGLALDELKYLAEKRGVNFWTEQREGRPSVLLGPSWGFMAWTGNETCSAEVIRGRVNAILKACWDSENCVN